MPSFDHRMNRHNLSSTVGFTLVELLVVMGIFATLSLLAWGVGGGAQVASETGIASAAQVLIADMKQQQINAMTGKVSDGAPREYGVRIDTSAYTLFGTAYDPGDPLNFTVDLERGINISTTLPSSQVLFARVSGEVVDFTPGQNTITLTDPGTGESAVLTINRWGAVTYTFP